MAVSKLAAVAFAVGTVVVMLTMSVGAKMAARAWWFNSGSGVKDALREGASNEPGKQGNRLGEHG